MHIIFLAKQNPYRIVNANIVCNKRKYFVYIEFCPRNIVQYCTLYETTSSLRISVNTLPTVFLFGILGMGAWPFELKKLACDL